jgi:hypothetical protein
MVFARARRANEGDGLLFGDVETRNSMLAVLDVLRQRGHVVNLDQGVGVTAAAHRHQLIAFAKASEGNRTPDRQQ